MRNQARKKKPDAGAEVEIDWVKVEMLRSAIEGDSYDVDARAVAEAMIDRTRGGG